MKGRAQELNLGSRFAGHHQRLLRAKNTRNSSHHENRSNRSKYALPVIPVMEFMGHMHGFSLMIQVECYRSMPHKFV